ncbi:MAG: dihydroneopterin aldolase [Chlorobi bacterium]|nr:dihydroneopterin aldolase [Chlorobiota bacterium]
MNKSTIRVLGAQVYAHHGVGAAEQELGGRYSFDLEIETDISEAATSDDLSDTVNYVNAYEIAHDVIVDTKRRLLESIVSQVADAILDQFPNALAVTIRLRKLRAPINGVLDAVEIEHKVSRKDG